MTRQYKIKDFSQMTGVTHRTLHYYEEIGLLTPASKTESGHRVYSEMDLKKLQQIVTLKFMGFSLKKIKAILSSKLFAYADSLDKQYQELKAQAERLEKAADLIKLVKRSSDEIDWDKMSKLIEVIEMSSAAQDKWKDIYFDDEDFKAYEAMIAAHGKSQWEAFEAEWGDIFAAIEKDDDTDPTSDFGKTIALRCGELIQRAYGDNLKLCMKIWDAHRAGIVPEKDFPYGKKVIDFIDSAMSFHLEKN